MKKNFFDKIIICVIIYFFITIICNISYFFLPGLRKPIFCVWFVLTLVFWALIAAVLLVIYYKLIKLTKRKNKFKEKEK